uniref:NADH dehydrogenase subunit 6 n=1 Tax=Lepidotrema longipenis TaxID=330067 RepID=A0A346Q016_9PLAT|nr:NADH dehydrogenase subunit 6 [Lepidotrema longipenis]AXR86342.1 NADH dehydrogenase subunit 6 [Lepidotrema longipenis]
MLSLFICFYLIGSASYLLVGSLLHYCLLLVFNAICITFSLYLLSNSMWYAIIFYMVYVGGIYILFIFLSVYTPNTSQSLDIGRLGLFFLVFFCWEISNLFNSNDLALLDESFYFCSFNECLSYLFICSFLLLGFFLVSYISGSKEYFIR